MDVQEMNFRISLGDKIVLEHILQRLQSNEIISLPKRRLLAEQLDAVVKRAEFLPSGSVNL